MSRLGDYWGAETSPSGVDGAFANSMEAIVPGVTSQVVQQPSETWIDALIRTANQLATGVQQIQLIQQNTQRARTGQLPLYFPPVTQQQAGMSEETKKMLLIGGLAVVGVFVLPKLMKG